jgi:hypothetical protein
MAIGRANLLERCNCRIEIAMFLAQSGQFGNHRGLVLLNEWIWQAHPLPFKPRDIWQARPVPRFLFWSPLRCGARQGSTTKPNYAGRSWPPQAPLKDIAHYLQPAPH